MTDNANITISSSSENSNDTNASEDSKPEAIHSKPASAETELSQKEIIANRERAIQLRAAKRALLQEPSTLVSIVLFVQISLHILVIQVMNFMTLLM